VDRSRTVGRLPATEP